jgi:hypothetical protein
MSQSMLAVEAPGWEGATKRPNSATLANADGCFFRGLTASAPGADR